MYISKKSDDDDLGKFYESRLNYYEEISNKSMRSNTTNTKPNTKKQSGVNFAIISNYKNVEPEKIMSYEQFKSEGNNIKEENSKRFKRAQSLSSLPMNQNKTKPMSTSRKHPTINLNNSLNSNVGPYKRSQKEITPKPLPENKSYNSFRVSGAVKKIPQSQVTSSTESNTNPSASTFSSGLGIQVKKLSPSFQPPVTLQQNGNNNPNASFQSSCSATSKCIPNKDYQNYLRTIYEKRKQILDEKVQNENTPYEPSIYERSKDYVAKTLEKNKQLKDALNKSELLECSFNPKITSSSQKILNDSVSYRSYNNIDDFYLKNLEWKSARDKNLQMKTCESERKKFEECSFQPNPERAGRIKRELKDKGTDYIYKKNIEWLNKVKENKKKNELEQAEQMELEREKAKRMIRSGSARVSDKRGKASFEENLEALARPKVHIEKRNPKQRVDYLHTTSRINPNNEVQTFSLENEIGDLKSLITSLKSSLEENKKIKEQLF